MTQFNNSDSMLTIASQQVIELQASKKQLAGVVLGPHDAEKAGDNLGSLHVGRPESFPCSSNSEEY